MKDKICKEIYLLFLKKKISLGSTEKESTLPSKPTAIYPCTNFAPVTEKSEPHPPPPNLSILLFSPLYLIGSYRTHLKKPEVLKQPLGAPKGISKWKAEMSLISLVSDLLS